MLKKLRSTVKTPAGRLQFAAQFVFSTGPMAMVNLFYWNNPELNPCWPVLIVMANLILPAAILLYAAQRLADLGRPARQAWLLLVPVYNVYLIVLLMTKRGNQPDSAQTAAKCPALWWINLGCGVFVWAVALVSAVFR